MVGIAGTQVFTNQPAPPVLRCIHTQAKAFLGLWPCLVMAEYPIYNHRRTTVRITYAHSRRRMLILKSANCQCRRNVPQLRASMP